jgi:hypothetical protein
MSRELKIALGIITSVFDGKGGTIMLMIMGNSQTWSQNDVDSFIASLN